MCPLEHLHQGIRPASRNHKVTYLDLVNVYKGVDKLCSIN